MLELPYPRSQAGLRGGRRADSDGFVSLPGTYVDASEAPGGAAQHRGGHARAGGQQWGAGGPSSCSYPTRPASAPQSPSSDGSGGRYAFAPQQQVGAGGGAYGGGGGALKPDPSLSPGSAVSSPLPGRPLAAGPAAPTAAPLPKLRWSALVDGPELATAVAPAPSAPLAADTSSMELGAAQLSRRRRASPMLRSASSMQLLHLPHHHASACELGDWPASAYDPQQPTAPQLPAQRQYQPLPQQQQQQPGTGGHFQRIPALARLPPPTAAAMAAAAGCPAPGAVGDAGHGMFGPHGPYASSRLPAGPAPQYGSAWHPGAAAPGTPVVGGEAPPARTSDFGGGSLAGPAAPAGPRKRALESASLGDYGDSSAHSPPLMPPPPPPHQQYWQPPRRHPQAQAHALHPQFHAHLHHHHHGPNPTQQQLLLPQRQYSCPQWHPQQQQQDLLEEEQHWHWQQAQRPGPGPAYTPFAVGAGSAEYGRAVLPPNRLVRPAYGPYARHSAPGSGAPPPDQLPPRSWQAGPRPLAAAASADLGRRLLGSGSNNNKNHVGDGASSGPACAAEQPGDLQLMEMLLGCSVDASEVDRDRDAHAGGGGPASTPCSRASSSWQPHEPPRDDEQRTSPPQQQRRQLPPQQQQHQMQQQQQQMHTLQQQMHPPRPQQQQQQPGGPWPAPWQNNGGVPANLGPLDDDMLMGIDEVPQDQLDLDMESIGHLFFDL